MRLLKTISDLRNNILPNISKKDDIISYINDAILNTHMVFNIRYEQAIILVPQNRNIFKIDASDPSVIMASYSKIAKCYMKLMGKDKNEKLKELAKDNELLDLSIMSDSSVNKDLSIFDNKDTKVLQLVEVTDDKNTKYAFNLENVFVLDIDTLHFPNAKDGDIIYVSYKPYPQLINDSNTDIELDLPDSLKDCAYAYITLKLMQNVSGIKHQFYANALNTYNNEVLKARGNGVIMPDPLIRDAVAKRGFI